MKQSSIGSKRERRRKQPVTKVPRGDAPRILLGIEAEKRRVLNEIRGVSTTKSPSKSRKRRPRDFCHGLLGVRQTLFLLAPYEPIAFNRRTVIRTRPRGRLCSPTSRAAGGGMARRRDSARFQIAAIAGEGSVLPSRCRRCGRAAAGPADS